MNMHSVLDEIILIIKMQERVAFTLDIQGRRRVRGSVIMPGMQHCFTRQFGFDALQCGEHLFRITALQIAATTAEYEQGVAGDQLAAKMVTG